MKSPHRFVGFVASAALFLSVSSPTFAADEPAPAKKGTACSNEQLAVAETHHTVTINGKPLAYTARVGYLQVTVDPSAFTGLNLTSGGSPSDVASAPYSGCFFYTYYKVDQGKGPARPLTFAFNGGPGSASLWLHLGLMGPRRVKTGATGLDVPSPYEMEDNQYSPLDLTDIVMIDPIGTGFSHAKKDPANKNDKGNQNFFGAIDDAESVATFIKTFVKANPQYNKSPLYVLGESYGGVRGSLVSQILPQALSSYPVGMIFISPCLTTTMTDFGSKDVPIAYLSFFPTMAEIARFHNQGIYAGDNSVSNEQLYKKAYDFAFNEYVPAIMKGTYLSPDDPEYVNITRKLADFTGMPQDHFAFKNSQGTGLDLRLTDQDFFSNLIPGEQVGRFDGRWTGPHTTDKTGYNAPDPSDTNTTKAFVPAINDYLLEDLQMKTPHSYVDSAAISYWSMSSDSAEFVGTMNLGYALAQNPNLNIFIASGYYDMACPMGGVEYERGQIDRGANGLGDGRASNDPQTGGRVEIEHYASGHMIYTNPVALAQLKADLTKFYGRTYRPATGSSTAAPTATKKTP